MRDLLQLVFAFLLLFCASFLFIHISRKLRKGGGSLTTTMLGATDLFYDKEKKNAVKQIIEMKTGTKQEEQSCENSKK
jgi:hypothetical protein